MRKSILSALYGNYAGRIDLNATIEQLGLDDDPPLTEEERHATLRMLLQSRSGVYHSFVGGTPEMRATNPPRGSHPPGHYNNWDFNAGRLSRDSRTRKSARLSATRLPHRSRCRIFVLKTCITCGRPINLTSSKKSIHPAYQFRLTVRDMARLGYLFLQGGDWNGTQVIPNAWVSENTRSYSDAGYGFGSATVSGGSMAITCRSTASVHGALLANALQSSPSARLSLLLPTTPSSRTLTRQCRT
jgi:CubicO group peptidase (beta-lactamase class C family)